MGRKQQQEQITQCPDKIASIWTATFEVLPADKVVLTYIAGPGGNITGTATQEINKGASGTAVTATPNAGYTFVKWSDGKTTATRTDTNVQVSATYTATFKSTNVVPKTGIFDDTGNTILSVLYFNNGFVKTCIYFTNEGIQCYFFYY